MIRCIRAHPPHTWPLIFKYQNYGSPFPALWPSTEALLTSPFRTSNSLSQLLGVWATEGSQLSPPQALPSATELLLGAASVQWLLKGGYKVLTSLASIGTTLKGHPSSKAPIRSIASEVVPIVWMRRSGSYVVCTSW